MDISRYKYINITEITGKTEFDVSNFLIKNNKLKTLEHVTAVANRINKIAEVYGLDKNVCTISSLLHDISVVSYPNDMLNYVFENDLFIDEAERKYPFLLHQRISKLLAMSFFKIDDDAVLSAIECHSTLKSNPSQYDMALFIADKLSWDQEGTPPFYDIVSESLTLSLEEACLAYINFIIDNNLILHPHSWIIEGQNYLKIYSLNINK